MEWYYYLAFAGIVVLTVIVCIKASKVSQKRNKRVREEMERLKHDAELKRDFAVVTSQLITSSDDRRLLEGIAMNIQLPLENESDMIAAFEPLDIRKKYMYTLEYFLQDASVSLSEFFKRNGRPLITLAPQALNEIGLVSIASIAGKMLPMCDDENEDVSVDAELRVSLDAEFAAMFKPEELCSAAASYIRSNIEAFITK